MICLTSWGQISVNGFTVIDLQSNDLEKVVTIRQSLPTIKYNVKLQDRKLYQQAVEIVVDSIIDTLTVAQGLSDPLIIKAYFHPNHWQADIISTAKIKEKNVGPLQLQSQEDWLISIQSYSYNQHEKYIYNIIHDKVPLAAIRLDGWLIFGHLILLIAFLFFLIKVLFLMIKKKIKINEIFFEALIEDENLLLIIIVLGLAGSIIVGCHHLTSLIIWLSICNLIIFAPQLALKVKKNYHRWKKRKTKK